MNNNDGIPDNLPHPSLVELSRAIANNPMDVKVYTTCGQVYFDEKQCEKDIVEFTRAIEVNPHKASLYIRRGYAYLQLKQHEEAILDFTRASEVKPKCADAYINRALTFFQLKRYCEALADCNQAIELDPNIAGAYNNRGLTYCEIGRCDEALVDFTRAIELDPHNEGYYYYNRGEAYLGLKRYNEAIADFTRTTELHPKDLTAYIRRGVTYCQLKRPDKAMADCTRAIELNPKDAYAYSVRGSSYSTLMRYDDAVADYTRAIELGTSNPIVTSYYGRAAVYFCLQRYDEALADCTRAIELDPSMATGYLFRTSAYIALKRYDEALTAANRAIELDPDNALAYYLRGSVYAAMKCSDNAIIDFTRAIELDPNMAAAYIGRGKAHSMMNCNDKALLDFTHAIELDPSSADAYDHRGDAHHQLKQYDKALTDLTLAIMLNPNSLSAYNNRGFAYQALDRYSEALADYSRAIELDPNLAQPYINRSNAYFHLDQFDEALANANSAIRLIPNSFAAYLTRGNAYYSLARYNDALTDYSRAIELNPNEAMVYSNRGNVYYHLDRYNDALVDYSRAIDLESNHNAYYYSCRGRILLNLKRYQEALDDAVKTLAIATDKDLEKHQALCIESCALIKLNRLDEANEILLKVELIYPQDEELHVIRISYYLQRRDLNGLRQCVDALRRIYEIKPIDEPEIRPTLIATTADDKSLQLSQLQQASVHRLLTELAPEFSLEQWLCFLATWFKVDDIAHQTYSAYVKMLDTMLVAMRERKTDITQPNTDEPALSDEIKRMHQRLFCLPGDMNNNALQETLKSGPELFAFRMKLALLSHVMQKTTPISSGQPIAINEYSRFAKAVYFHKRLSEALYQNYAERIEQTEREKAEGLIVARIEERNKVIQDLSHSIKNLVASVVDPLNELSERFTEERVTIQKALRGATLIRETVNAMNLSFRGRLEDFAMDADEAVQHPEKSVSLEHLIEVSLQCSVNNMFDGKYFADFVHQYFSTKAIYDEAQAAWAAVHTEAGTKSMVAFLEKYMFEISLEYPPDIKEFRLGDRYNSPLKLTLLFQELLLNAVKYACFTERKDRCISIRILADDQLLSLVIQNAYVPERSARTTRIGNEIIQNFVKLLEGTMSVDKTNTIYTTAVKFPNIFNSDRRTMIIKRQP